MLWYNFRRKVDGEEKMESVSNRGLIWLKTPEDAEIEGHLAEIQATQNQIAELTLALEDLKLDVSRFETKYNAILGRLFVELDKVNLEVKEYMQRIRLVREQEIISKEEIDVRVQESFKEERQKVSQQTQQVNQDEQEYEKIKAKKETDTTATKRLRKLYLKLAKIYHPDKAENDAEREKNERMMSLINSAYEENDILTLERLLSTADDREEIAGETKAEKRRRLRRERRKLDRIVASLNMEIETIKRTETYKFKVEVEEAQAHGEELFGKLAKDLKRKIEAGKRRLKGMMQTFRNLMRLRFF